MLHREIARGKGSRYPRVMGYSSAIGPLSSCWTPSAIYSRLETLNEIPYYSSHDVILGDNEEYVLGISQEFLGAWSKFFSQCRDTYRSLGFIVEAAKTVCSSRVATYLNRVYACGTEVLVPVGWPVLQFFLKSLSFRPRSNVTGQSE